MASAANPVSIDRATVERIVRQVALESLRRDKSVPASEYAAILRDNGIEVLLA